MEKLAISILLVEDDVVIRNIYSQLLNRKVAKLYVAGDGNAGYESYKANKPNLIITDIKMPVMNGLDMVKKIRKVDKEQRIIIMSAYGESRFFLRAIEVGVKGFLIKPVDTDHLFSIIDEQAKDILLEKRFTQEALMRRTAEFELDKSDNILKSLAQATLRFFQYGVNTETINQTLMEIGQNIGVSRSYIFSIHTNNNIRYLTQIQEWVADGISPQINNRNLIGIPETDILFRTWEKQMLEHKNIVGFPKDFEEPNKTILSDQNIKSIISIPIFVKDQWWGFIGFDDCIENRNWTIAEVKALEMLAYNLGAAIYRREVEEKMIELNSNLEERVRDRTKDLEQEVADRIIAEKLLRESEEKYRLIYENANSGILLIISGYIKMINPKIVEIFNMQPREIIGKKFSSLVEHKYSADITNNYEKENHNQDYTETNIQVRILNGKYLELNSTNILWDEDPANLIFLSNISKRKVAQQNLFNLNRDLEKRIKEEVDRTNRQQQLLVQKSKLESIGELSAGLAHEINQPLGSISMGLENILFNVNNNGIDTEYLRNKINILFRDVDRIKKIIEHVRLFSRDQEKYIETKVCVNDVINNALSMVSKQFADRNIVIDVNLPMESVYTKGNKYRLEQVILNLLSNARHAVDEKERKLGAMFSKIISINLEYNECNCITTINDNGIGVKSNIKSKVFDPFFTTKSEEKGTGLGLSISYGIISEMNGSIILESTENQFTNVIINLPCNIENE